MIRITKRLSLIADNGWDYPISEIEYLCDHHDGQTFVLIGDRLYEAFDEWEESEE